MEIPATESVESPPRSKTTQDHPPPAKKKLRLMCSYGGQIVPRPHDKSLCYVGGETRIVVADRSSSLSDLRSRLSKKLLGGGGGSGFSLKYQLPSEDLDSLISVTTEEDLDNMIDEYDRSKPNRLRLFLFSFAVEKDDWLVAALNAGGSSAVTTSVNCLLGLDDIAVIPPENKQRKLQEVQSVLDSPMLENTSSFGSTSSSRSPAIRAFAVESSAPPPAPPIEDQFSQITVADNDDRSDHSFGNLKNQQQNQNPIAGVLDLTSPDSVSSDSSFTRTTKPQQQFNDPISQIASANTKSNTSDLKNSVYALPPTTAYYQPVYYIQARAPPQQVYYAGYSPATGSSYAYDYSGRQQPPPQQVYFAGAPPQMTSQYQFSPAPPAKSMNDQQMRNSQPL